MITRILLLLCLLALPVLAMPDPPTVPHRPDSTFIPRMAEPPPMKERSHHPITIFTAARILTLNPAHPEATAVAVQDGRILAVGDLAQAKSWVRDEPFEVDERFAKAVLLPGFVEAHMHPHITGVLWQSVYIGRFDRYDPDGNFVAGLKTKKEVLDRLAAASRRLGENDKWLVAWGYQPEFYNNSPLTVTDLDPITSKHPTLIENASMHIYYVNSLALDKTGVTHGSPVKGVVMKDGKPTGEFQEAEAVFKLLPYLPKVDEAFLLKSTWNAARLANQVGVTSIADASFGMIPGAYKAYATAAADPRYPVRTTLYPLLDFIRSQSIQQKGGLDYVKQVMRDNTDMLSVGAIKFICDGSVQGETANLFWPYYYHTGRNGVANMSVADLQEWVLKVHEAGLQCMIHTNANQATEQALQAIQRAQDLHPRVDHRHRLEHNQMVTDSQLDRMRTLGVGTNLFINHVYYWGDLHRDVFLGPERAAGMNPLASAKRHGVRFATHSDASVTRLDPLLSVWVATNRKTLSGRELGPEEKISVEDALRMVTIDAAWLMFQDNLKGSIEAGKYADFAVLAEDPTRVPVDHIKDIQVLGTVMGGRYFPSNLKRHTP